MTEVDSKLVSPATTPGSTGDDERFLVPNLRSSSTKTFWYFQYILPYFTTAASLLQIIMFLTGDEELDKLLRYEPNAQKEIWRFWTYMFIHNSTYHIILNIIFQCLFAITLEEKQGGVRVGLLYLGGGAVGALGASCVNADIIVGASAGVYALLISHIAHVLLNFHCSRHKFYHCAGVGIIVVSDVVYNLIHVYTKGEPTISWGAHISGAITGFLLGLVLFKSPDDTKKNRVLFWSGLLLFVVLLIFLEILNFQIRRCTPINLVRVRYTYIC